METEADRQAMLVALGLGVRATVNGVAFPVAFDYEFVTLTLGDAESESRAPVITASDADLDAAQVTKGVEIALSNGKSFIARRAEPDGFGLTRWILGT